ncbi:MAG: hypothetical protein HY928_02275 [Elusimicrobia bacterium]|nr:hypothetical protein [Elusimicrobiota bacterium]
MASANIQAGAIITAKIADGVITTAKLVAEAKGPWQFLGRQILGGAAPGISVVVPPKRYYKAQLYLAGKSGSTSTALRFNGDTATNYSYNYIVNAGAAVTGVGVARLQVDQASVAAEFITFEVASIAGSTAVTGAVMEGLSPPSMSRFVGFYNGNVGTSIDVDGGGSNFQAGSELVVYGGD